MKSTNQVANLISDTLDTLPQIPNKESILVAAVLIELIQRLHKEVPTEWMYFNGKFECTIEFLEYYAGLSDRGLRDLDGCIGSAQTYWHGVIRNIEEVMKTNESSKA